MKEKKFFVTLRLVLVISLLVATLGYVDSVEAAKSKVYRWKLSTYGTPSDWEFLGIKYLCNKVKDMSAGRLILKPFPVGQLYPPTDVVAGVSKRLSEMAVTVGAYLTGVHPAFGIHCSFPGGPIENFYQEMILVQQPAWKKVTEKLYGPKIHHIAYGVNPPTALLSNRKIKTIDDFKGLLVRSCSPGDRMFVSLGAKPTYIATPEIYTALQLGTIDAVDKGNYVTVYGLRLHEVTKYLIEPQFVCPPSAMDYIANKESWDSLPPDLQAILREAVISQAVHFYTEAKRQGFEARQKMIDAGLEVNTIGSEGMKEIYAKARTVWEKIASENEQSAELLKVYLDTIKGLGY